MLVCSVSCGVSLYLRHRLVKTITTTITIATKSRVMKADSAIMIAVTVTWELTLLDVVIVVDAAGIVVSFVAAAVAVAVTVAVVAATVGSAAIAAVVSVVSAVPVVMSVVGAVVVSGAGAATVVLVAVSVVMSIVVVVVVANVATAVVSTVNSVDPDPIGGKKQLCMITYH